MELMLFHGGEHEVIDRVTNPTLIVNRWWLNASERAGLPERFCLLIIAIGLARIRSALFDP